MVKLALCLVHTDTNEPVTKKIERAVSLPTYQFTFDDTAEGRAKAAVAIHQLNDYLAKYHIPKSRKTPVCH